MKLPTLLGSLRYFPLALGGAAFAICFRITKGY